jgi:hypothetical protein
MAITPTQQINLVRHEANKTLVNINGTDYEFTIKTKAADGSWTDVTAGRDWTEVAQLVAELCKQVSNQNAFQKAVLETTGGLPDLNNLATPEPGFHSIHVDYGNKDNLQSCRYDSTTLPADKQTVVAQHLTAMAITSLSNSFVTRPPGDVGVWMNRHLQANHSKIYRAVTSMIYQTELKKWEAAPPQGRGNKPGTEEVRVTTSDGTTTVFPKEKYGAGRFVAMRDEERAAFLLAQKKALIAHTLQK